MAQDRPPTGRVSYVVFVLGCMATAWFTVMGFAGLLRVPESNGTKLNIALALVAFAVTRLAKFIQPPTKS